MPAFGAACEVVGVRYGDGRAPTGGRAGVKTDPDATDVIPGREQALSDLRGFVYRIGDPWVLTKDPWRAYVGIGTWNDELEHWAQEHVGRFATQLEALDAVCQRLQDEAKP